MKVFISWSGEPSKRVAALLNKYLPAIHHGLQTFMSEHDIGSGDRWFKEISEKLDESNFGIMCLTPDNLTEPWILFEAGALTKHVAGKACGLLFRGLETTGVKGPLAQFQNQIFDRAGFEKLVFDLNKNVENTIGESTLRISFDQIWPKLEQEVTTALNDPELDAPIGNKREVNEVVEEILDRVRDIQRSNEIGTNSDTPQFYHYKNNPIDVLFTLPPKVQLILTEFINAEGSVVDVNSDRLEEKYKSSDIARLLQRRVLTLRDDGAYIIDPAIGDALRWHLSRSFLDRKPMM